MLVFTIKIKSCVHKYKNKLKKNRIFILYAICLVLFFSCEDEGQINGAIIEPQQDEYISSDLDPGGENFGHVGNLYLNLASGNNYSERYWKFNYFHLSGGNHIGPDEDSPFPPDILTLNSYHDSYYVPSNDFKAPCFDFETETALYVDSETDCINQEGLWLGDGDLAYVFSSEPSCYLDGQKVEDSCGTGECENYLTEEECSNSLECEWISYNTLQACEDFNNNAIFYNENSYIPLIHDTQTDLTTEVTRDSYTVEFESELSLKTPPLTGDNAIEEMSWNVSENMYSFSTMDQIRDTLVIDYSYEYESKENFVPIDVVLTPVLDDVMIIVDNVDENSQARSYDVFDTLQVEGQEDLPVLISREHTFYSYSNQLNYSFGQRQTTDCNDNYQKDMAELREVDFSNGCGSCSDDEGSIPELDNLHDCEKDNNQFRCEDSGELFSDSDICLLSCENVPCDLIFNTWDSDWVTNGCDSFCSSGENADVKMLDLCWNSAIDDPRLTAHCIDDSDVADLPFTFCDFGNNLYDGKEVLYDIIENGIQDELGGVGGGQGIEPFEDRNCDGVFNPSMEAELSDLNEENCALAPNYGTWKEGRCFRDSGNLQWDDEELCYGDAESCNYIDLYTRGLAPNYLLVTYEDQGSPAIITEVYPGDVYEDCGVDMECNEDEDDFNPGSCSDGFSGTEELCYRHNGCWNYETDPVTGTAIGYDMDLEGCDQENSVWLELTDPEEDDYSTDPDGAEKNLEYDEGEKVIRDFNGDGGYSTPTRITTKLLGYEECSLDAVSNPDNNCGNDSFEIISDEIKSLMSSVEIQKEESKVNLSSYSLIGQIPIIADSLNNLNILKTQWPDSDEADGDAEDYMLFMNSHNSDASGMHYIIKMIQPYYYYADTPYSGGFETLPDEWWKSLEWEQDTLIYSLAGSIIDGQTHYSSYSVESDTANYTVHKEYEVGVANAEMVYSNTIPDCILVTRTITTTMLGSAVDFKIKSETYLKEGFPIVKEDIYWSWPPVFEGDRIFTKISSIESCGSECPPPSGRPSTNLSANSFFDVIQSLELDQLHNNQDFDFDQFKPSNTMGVQRVEVPE